MNVYLIGSFYFPDKTAAAHLIRGIAKIIEITGNYQVTIIDAILSNECQKRVVHIINPYGLNVIQINYPNSLRGKMQKKYGYKFLRQLVSDNSIVIFYNYEAFILLKLSHEKKGRIIRVPMITEWYSAGEIKGITSFFHTILNRIDIDLRMRILNKKNEGMIVCSELLYDYYKRFFPIVIIPTVIDYSQDKWHQPRLSFDQKMINFVYAGSLGVRKDNLIKIMEIVEKASEGSPYIIRILGITVDDFQNKYPNNLQYALKKEHIFYGRKSNFECIQIIQSSDFSLLYRENNRVANAGFPTKFGESMACGTPMILTNTSDIKKYLYDDINGIIIDFEIEKAALQVKEIFKYSREEIEKKKIQTRSLRLFDLNEYIEPMRILFEHLERK
jgi:glycosyltransferase involved in cell wall biosynthesis